MKMACGKTPVSLCGSEKQRKEERDEKDDTMGGNRF